MGVQPNLRGLLNVESGCAAVSIRVREYCDCVDDRLGSYGDACKDCGASAETFVRVPASDGDKKPDDYRVEQPKGTSTLESRSS